MIFLWFDCAFEFLFISVLLTKLLFAKKIQGKTVVENASNGGRSIEKHTCGVRTHVVLRCANEKLKYYCQLKRFNG